jgi:hypothetical protein
MYTDPNGHAEIKANGREYTPKEYAEERELFKKLGRMIDLLEQGDKSVSAKDISKAGGTGFAESMSNIHLFELRYSISNRVDEIESYKTTISNYVNQLNKATNQADIDKYKAQIQAAYNAYQKQVTYLQSNWGIQVNGFEVVKNDAYYQAVATVYRYGNQNDSVFANNPALDFCNVMLALGEMGIGITGNKVLNNSKSSSGNQNNSSSASTNNQGKTAGLKEKAGNLVKGIVEKVKGVLGIGEGTSSTAKPTQTHHFLTNKSSTYTAQIEKITKKYGLDLDGSWNKAAMQHQGRHPNAYHDYMLNEIKRIDSIAKGDTNIFLKLFESVKNEVLKNPDMLTKSFWE